MLCQFEYNVQTFLEFVEGCRRAHIELPIIPGVLPMYNHDSWQRIVTHCGVTLPSDLKDALRRKTSSGAHRCACDCYLHQFFCVCTCPDRLRRGTCVVCHPSGPMCSPQLHPSSTPSLTAGATPQGTTSLSICGVSSVIAPPLSTAEFQALGLQVVTSLCRQLLEEGFPVLHFFTLNLEHVVNSVLKELGLGADSQARRALPWRPSMCAGREKESVRYVVMSTLIVGWRILIEQCCTLTHSPRVRFLSLSLSLSLCVCVSLSHPPTTRSRL